MTPRLPGHRPPRQPGGNTGFWLGMAAIIGAVLGFMGFVSVVLPDAIFLFLVMFGFVGFIALHYVTWGRWLTRVLKAEPQQDEPAWPSPPQPSEADINSAEIGSTHPN